MIPHADTIRLAYMERRKADMMELILSGSRSICPICKGLVHELIDSMLYRCYDCKTLYEVTEKGYAEKALNVKIVDG